MTPVGTIVVIVLVLFVLSLLLVMFLMLGKVKRRDGPPE